MTTRDLYYSGVYYRRGEYPRQRRAWNLKMVLTAAAPLTLFVVWFTVLSQSIFPDAGIWTRIVYGNAIADRNYAGRKLLLSGQQLTFIVAGWEYTVISPSRALTVREQQDLVGYAAFKGFPSYTVDGPLAIDP